METQKFTTKKEDLKNLPETPGVYHFFNSNEEIIYIGKSINLKNRVASYFSSKQDHNRTKRMVKEIQNIEIKTTKTELLALLLEDRLIKKHLPRYNVKQKDFPKYKYLLLTNSKFPILKIEENPCGKIFGPFKDEYFAQNLQKLLCQYFKVCLCVSNAKAKKCLYPQINFCAAPYHQKVSSEEYTQIIDKVVAFLEEGKENILEILKKRIKELATRWKFEEADKVNKQYELCRNFCQRQQFVYSFINKNLVIWEKSATYIFCQGQLTKSYAKVLKIELILSLLSKTCAQEDRRFLLDRANLVYKWLKRYPQNRYVFVDV